VNAENEAASRLVELTPEARPASLRCVLIHGTWAPNAPWTESNSEISQSLRCLAGGSVHLSKFVWSGANDQQARERAADVLAAALAELAAQNTSASILLVAHSHGGNVAMQAVRGIPIAQQAGVICMATPFFHVRARGTFPTRWLQAAAVQGLVGLYFAVSGAFSYGLMWLLPWLVQFRDWASTLFWGHAFAATWHALAGLGGFVLYVVGFSAQYFKEPSFVTRQQATRIARWQRVQPAATHVLCIFYRPDEAFWSLRGARTIGEFGHFATTSISRWALPVLAVLIGVASIWFGWKSGESIVSPTLASLSRLTMTALALIVSAAVIAIVPVVLWAIVGLLGSLPRFATGNVSLFDHLFLDIHASRVPQIPAQNLEEVPLSLTTATNWFETVWASFPFSEGLVHSRVYSDKRAFEAIQNWYKNREVPPTFFPSFGTSAQRR
jgi:hypothetical protein